MISELISKFEMIPLPKFSLFANAESSQFNEALDRALFTADVMGFVDSKEGK